MAFDILGFYNKHKDYYKDAPLGEVAKDVYTRAGYDKEYPDFDTWAKQEGVDQPVQDDLKRRNPQKEGSALGALGKTLLSVPENIAASAITAIQGGGGASINDRGLGDRFVNWVSKRNEELSKEYEGTGDVIPGVISKQDIAQLGQNLGFSGVSMVAGAAGGVAGAPGGLGGIFAGRMLGAGAAAHRMQSYQTMNDWLNRKNEESIKLHGRGINPEEEKAFKDKFEGLASQSGLWEAGPEGVGTALELAVILAKNKTPGGKLIPDSVIKKLAKGAVKLGKVIGIEEATETVTQMGQHNVEVEAGMAAGPKREWTSPEDWLTSAKEVLPAVLLLSGFIGGAGAVYNRLQAVEDNPPELEREINKLKIGALATDFIDKGLKAGTVDGDPFTPENALEIIREGQKSGIYDDESIDRFKERYPQLRDGLNGVIADRFADKVAEQVLGPKRIIPARDITPDVPDFAPPEETGVPIVPKPKAPEGPAGVVLEGGEANGPLQTETEVADLAAQDAKREEFYDKARAAGIPEERIQQLKDNQAEIEGNIGEPPIEPAGVPVKPNPKEPEGPAGAETVTEPPAIGSAPATVTDTEKSFIQKLEDGQDSLPEEEFDRLDSEFTDELHKRDKNLAWRFTGEKGSRKVEVFSSHDWQQEHILSGGLTNIYHYDIGNFQYKEGSIFTLITDRGRHIPVKVVSAKDGKITEAVDMTYGKTGRVLVRDGRALSTNEILEEKDWVAPKKTGEKTQPAPLPKPPEDSISGKVEGFKAADKAQKTDIGIKGRRKNGGFVIEAFDKDGNIIGTAEFAELWRGVFVPNSIDVNPKYHRTGIASKLYDSAIDLIPEGNKIDFRNYDIRSEQGELFKEAYDKKRGYSGEQITTEERSGKYIPHPTDTVATRGKKPSIEGKVEAAGEFKKPPPRRDSDDISPEEMRKLLDERVPGRKELEAVRNEFDKLLKTATGPLEEVIYKGKKYWATSVNTLREVFYADHNMPKEVQDRILKNSGIEAGKIVRETTEANKKNKKQPEEKVEEKKEAVPEKVEEKTEEKAPYGRAGMAAFKKMGDLAGLKDPSDGPDYDDLVNYFETYYKAGLSGAPIPKIDIHPQDARAAYEAGRKDAGKKQAPKDTLFNKEPPGGWTEADKVPDKYRKKPAEAAGPTKLAGKYDNTGDKDASHENGSLEPERKFKKDLIKYAARLQSMLGYEPDITTKGKKSKDTTVSTNIAPVGGDGHIILWKPNSEYGIYMTISVQRDYGEDGLTIKGIYNDIMYRATTKANKYNGMANRWAKGDISAEDLAEKIKNEVDFYDQVKGAAEIIQEAKDAGISKAAERALSEGEKAGEIEGADLTETEIDAKITEAAAELGVEVKPFFQETGFAPEILVDGTWNRNGLVFATEQEAADWASDRHGKWMMSRGHRAVPVNETPKNTFIDGELGDIKATTTAAEAVKPEPKESAFTAAVGIVGGGVADRIKESKYEFVYGPTERAGFKHYEMVGMFSGAKADRLIDAGITIKLKETAAPEAKEEFKVGDILDPQGNTNMVGKVTIREIQGNTLKFVDSEGTEFSGMQRSLVRDLIKGGSWSKVPKAKGEETKAPAPFFRETGVSMKDGKLVIDNGEVAKPAKDETAQAESPAFGSENKIFTEDKANKAREILRKKLGGINMGVPLDPEIIQAGIDLAGYYIEGGARSFSAYASKMINDLGDMVRPYLKSFYMAVRNYPGFDKTGMDNEAALDEIDEKAIDITLTNQAESVNITTKGGQNEHPTDGSAGEGTLEGDKSGNLSADGRGQGARGGKRGSSQADNEGNQDLDAGGLDGSGSVAGKSSPIHLQDSGTDGEVLPAESSAVDETPASEPRTIQLSGINPGNYRITEEDDIGSGTRGQKIDRNIAAIRLIKKLDQEHRYPTKEEQSVLAKYVGWGGIKNVFDETSNKPQDQRAYADLKELLTKEEFFEARQSVLNAHYTSPQIIRSIYKIMSHFGFTGGNILEPTYGAGNFIGLMPEDMAASSKWYGSELDPITAKIGQYLYPDSQLIHSGFQNAEFPYGKFDAEIGNPPFGDVRISDTRKERAEINRMKIHNYVISKSGLHLRPGGISANVITTRFLDTADPEARDFLAKQFKFLGAIRLPNDAFAKNAGTEVTTDLVFFQRLMPGEKPDMSADWLTTGATITNKDGEKITLNKYFAERPELMLGEPSMKGTMYGGAWKEGGKGEFTLNKREGVDIEEAIDKVIRESFFDLKDVAKNNNDKLDAAALSLIPNKEDVAVGGFFMDKDNIFMREDNDEYGNPTYTRLTPKTQWTEKQLLGETRYLRIKGMLELRAKAYELVNAERFDLGNIEHLRKQLNFLYDNFVKNYGFINESSNFSLMSDDIKIEFGLEIDFKKEITKAKAKSLGVKPSPASAEKATLLKERMFYPEKEILYAKDAADGYNISLFQKGKLDIDYIAKLTGTAKESVIADLSKDGLIYQDPDTKEWIQEDEYLSGNVKAKYKKVEGKEGFEKNAKDLKKVFPADVPTEAIFANPGATWIPEKVYEQFGHFIGVENPSVSIYRNNGQFSMHSSGQRQNDINVAWLNSYYSLSDIFNAVANNKVLIAWDGTGDDRTQNKEQTAELATIVQGVRSTFSDWIFADDARASELTKIYNATQNTHAKRKNDGTHLHTVGASPAVILRNTQRDAAWRIIQSKRVLLDHCVGAGKTYTIITGVQERVRMGLTRKAMIAVPNHLVGQWAADYMRLYPGARILAATKKDFSKPNRRRLFARIATGKYDAIIVGHSSFGFIPLETESLTNLMMEEIAQLEAAHAQADADGNKRLVKTLANRIAKKREKINELLGRPRDNVTTFEAMGIDHLVVDESHEFKNLEYSSAMQNITGMGNPMGSKRAFDMYAKIRWLTAQKDYALNFATGTPISNSLVEMYALLRYMNRDALYARGIDAFDSWANTYASIEPRIEYTASQKLKQRTVMATFNNLPELLQLYEEFADIVTMPDLKRIYAEQIRERNARTGGNESEDFPVPKVKDGGRTLDVADPSPEQVEYVDYLVARAERMEELGRQNDPKVDNHLWIMSDARKMALDIRLVDPTAKESPNNKINRATKRIKEIYDRTEKDKGAQLVFCDLSTPSGSAQKNAAVFIREALKKAHLETDARTKAILDSLSTYQEKWGYIRNRLEAEIEAISDHSQAETEQYMKRREEIEDYLEKVTDDVTSDLTTADTGFSVYDEMKSKLIMMGIPEGEVKFIHDANTEQQKEDLFATVNSGQVRVLLGSSQKMGAGMNVQERLVALHHMDAPWRPSDVEQREGRLVRQGNKLYSINPAGFKVEIKAYSTSNTFDAVMWQILARKGGMLDDFRSGRRTVEEVSMDGANYSEFMAETTGNPAFKEKFKLEGDIKSLRAIKNRTTTRLRSSQQSIDYNKDARIKSQAGIEKRDKIINDLKGQSTFTFEGKQYKDNAKDLVAKEANDIAEYNARVNKEYNAAIDAAINKAFEDKYKNTGLMGAWITPVYPRYTDVRSQEMKDYKEDLARHALFMETEESKNILAEAIKGIKKPTNKHFHSTKLAKSDKTGVIAAALKMVDEINALDDGESFTYQLGNTEIEIKKTDGGLSNHVKVEDRTRLWDYVVTADGMFLDRLERVDDFDERNIWNLLNVEAVNNRMTGHRRDAANYIERMDRSDEVSKHTLESLKFKDDEKLKRMEARYQEVLVEVQDAEAEISARRAATGNKYIRDDRPRFPAGVWNPHGNDDNQAALNDESDDPRKRSLQDNIKELNKHLKSEKKGSAEYNRLIEVRKGFESEIKALTNPDEVIDEDIETLKNKLTQLHKETDADLIDEKIAAARKLKYLDAEEKELKSISTNYAINLAEMARIKALLSQSGEGTTINEAQEDMDAAYEQWNEYHEGEAYPHEIKLAQQVVNSISSGQGRLFKGQQYSVQSEGNETVTMPTLAEVQEIFKGQEVMELPGGEFMIRTNNGKFVTIVGVDHISAKAINLKATYGKSNLGKGETVAGGYANNKKLGTGVIKLVRGQAGKWTLAHESMHFIEDSGLLTNAEINLLKKHIQNLAQAGKFEPVNPENIGGEEDRANFIATAITKEPAGFLGRIIAKIKDFIDKLVNAFGIRTAGGVARDIRTGKVYDRQGGAGRGLDENYSVKTTDRTKVFDANGKEVGFYVTRPEMAFKPGDFYIDFLTVNKELRGTGKFADILGQISVDAESEGAERVVLEVADEDAALGPMYKRYGFREAKSKAGNYFYISVDKLSNYVKGGGNVGSEGKGRVNFQRQKKYSIRTDAFKKWFGNSQVVDENGEPLVVYKGMLRNDWRTGKEINEINSTNGPWAGFFTSLKPVAKGFEEAFATMGEARTLEVYLAIKNPYIIDAKGKRAKEFMFDDTVFGKNPTNPGALAAFNNGYDGVIIKNTEDEGDVYIPKSPNQVKSATDNVGTFDENNPDIRYSIRKSQDPPTSRDPKVLNLYLKDETDALIQTMMNKLHPKQMTWLETILKSPEWFDHPQMKAITKIFMRDRNEIYHETFNNLNLADDMDTEQETISEAAKALKNKGLTLAERFAGKVSPEYQKLQEILDEGDTSWQRNTSLPLEDQIAKFEQHIRRQGATEDTIRVWKLYRQSYDKALDLMTAQLRRMIEEITEEANLRGEKPDVSELSQTLKGALAQMKQWKGFYAPRLREMGNWKVQAYKEHGPMKENREWYREHKGSELSARRLAQKLQREGWKIHAVGEVERLPESVYQDVKSVATAKLIDSALEKMSKKSSLGDKAMKLNEEVLRAVSDEIKARGFRSTMIHRGRGNVVRGFIEDPIQRHLQYINNVSGGIAKARSAKMAMKELHGEIVMGKQVGGIDPAKDPKAYQVATNYIEEQLRNSEPIDRMIGLAKSIATFKFLGFNLRSLAVNTTAIVTTAPAAIHQYALGGKGSLTRIIKELAAAGKDYAGYMAGKAPADQWEQAFLNEITKLGWDDAQYTREALGEISKTHSRVWSSMMDASMYLFGKSEQWNRGTTMLAAYRLARKQGMNHIHASEAAKNASDKAHGVYGKSTMPMWAMGTNPAAKIGQMFYVYQKFGHNYLQMLYDMGAKKHNIKGLMFATLSPLVLAGAAAAPLKEVFLAMFAPLFRLLFDDDRDPEKWVWDEIRKHLGAEAEKIGRHGLTGAMGVDISSSLSAGVGIPKNFIDLTGAIGGVATEIVEAKESIRNKQYGRAAEHLLPTGLANPLRAMREATEGATTRNNRRVWDEKGKPYLPSAGETAVRAVGFRSTDQATISERTWEGHRQQAHFSEMRDRLYERYRAWMLGKRDRREYLEIVAEVREYNRKAKGKAGVSQITTQSLQNQARRMAAPSKNERAILQ